MQIQLEISQVVETSDNHQLVLCYSRAQALPGQYLFYGDQRLAVIRCRQTDKIYEWLIQIPKDFHLSGYERVRLVGTAVTFIPSIPIYIFAEGDGIAMAWHWLDHLRQTLGNKASRKLLQTVIISHASEFTFAPIPSTFMLPDLPCTMIAAVPLLEDLGIPSRLCCEQFKPGCFEGNLAQLVTHVDWQVTNSSWLGFISKDSKAAITERLGKATELVVLGD